METTYLIGAFLLGYAMAHIRGRAKLKRQQELHMYERECWRARVLEARSDAQAGHHESLAYPDWETLFKSFQ